jgi:hypothetical protein
MCINCGVNNSQIDYPFCNSSCRVEYLIRLEKSAYHRDAIKYPEFLDELDLFIKFPQHNPDPAVKPSPSLYFGKSFLL